MEGSGEACGHKAGATVDQVQWMKATPIEVIRTDPVRTGHGILTGIGFLGAGVSSVTPRAS